MRKDLPHQMLWPCAEESMVKLWITGTVTPDRISGAKNARKNGRQEVRRFQWVGVCTQAATR